jgi:hypothetical protein
MGIHTSAFTVLRQLQNQSVVDNVGVYQGLMLLKSEFIGGQCVGDSKELQGTRFCVRPERDIQLKTKISRGSRM